MKKSKKRKIGMGHDPVPFSRAHSDKVKENKKEQRRRAKKESEEQE